MSFFFRCFASLFYFIFYFSLFFPSLYSASFYSSISFRDFGVLPSFLRFDNNSYTIFAFSSISMSYVVFACTSCVLYYCALYMCRYVSLNRSRAKSFVDFLSLFIYISWDSRSYFVLMYAFGFRRCFFFSIFVCIVRAFCMLFGYSRNL